MSLESQPLAVIGPIHGNEPLAAHIIGSYPKRDDVATYIPHPEALKAGERFLGQEGEMGGLVSDDPTALQAANIDRRRAAQLHWWLRKHNPWMTLSPHSNEGTTPGPDRIEVNSVTSPGSLAVALMLNVDNVVVWDDYPLHSLHPEVIETEQLVDDSTNLDSLIQHWHGVIDSIRSMGQSSMDRLGTELVSELRYFKSAGVVRIINKDGSPNPPVLNALEALEKSVPADKIRRLEPIDLSPELRAVVGASGRQLYINTWNHRNMARVLPPNIYGVSALDGSPRREFIGSFYEEIDPPAQTGPGEITFRMP